MQQKFVITSPDHPARRISAMAKPESAPALAVPAPALTVVDLDHAVTTPARQSCMPERRKRSQRSSLVQARTGLLNYDFVKRIGEGGMAEVWLVNRQGHGGFRKRLALKRLLPQLRGSAELEARFIEEARIAASLDHPNVIQAVDFGDSDHGLFLAMEFVDGASVRELQAHFRDARLRFPVDIALHLARQAAEALVYVHGATDAVGRPMGLVHRDVTPANLLVDRTGQLKLTDFGIALSGAAGHAESELPMVGSIGYMSPEQVLGEPLRAESDVYALGVVLAELLGGERLFPGRADAESSLAARGAVLARLGALLAGLPGPLVALIRQMLSIDPDDRPSAQELAARLELLRHGRPAGQDAGQRLANLVTHLRDRKHDAHEDGQQDVAQAATALAPAERLTPMALVRTGLFVARKRARRALRRHAANFGSAVVGGMSAALMFWALQASGSLAPAPPEPSFVLVPLGVELLTDKHGRPLSPQSHAGAR